MALDDKSILNNKLSPLIEGQVPDFVQSDHPLFVNFLKDYYKFLEAGQLKISTNIDYIALETSSSSYIINEDDSDRIVTEFGAGTEGFFVVGEIITGETSKATAEVLVDDSRNARIFITSQQKFITGETITGGTSNSTGKVVEYRGNPVQNIQQMLNYADVDNTIYDFLDKIKDSFMIDIPNDLASGISSRNLIKNIKDLYAAKGTSEGHKLFMQILLGESSDIFYPNQFMIKPSAATFEILTTLRVLGFSGSSGQEIVNQLITGQTSGATAIVVNSFITQQTKTVGSTTFNDSVTELEVSNINGTFLEDEVIIGVSTKTDQESRFTIKGIVSSATVVNDGILYTDGETIDVEVVGNGIADLVVDGIKSGSVIGFHIENSGTGYSIGDPLVFTSAAADTEIGKARGEVVMVGGGIQLESGTLDDSTITDDTLVLEAGSVLSFVPFNFLLEQVLEDTLIADGVTTAFTLTNVNASNDNITVFINSNKIADNFTNSPNSSLRINEVGLVEVFNENKVNVNWVASGTTITFTNAPAAETTIKIFGGSSDSLILDRTDLVDVSGSGSSATGGANSGHKLESNTANLELDRYSSARDGFILEEETFANLGVSSEAGEIKRAAITENSGYTELPTITVTSLSGTGAKILGLTKTIGAVNNVKIKNSGFRYSDTNSPELTFRAHFILKDVTGTFAKDNTLTTHTGTVVDWDSTKNILTTTFENVRRITQEQTGTFNENIRLESETQLLSSSGIMLEDEQASDSTGFTNSRGIFVEEDRIVFDATHVSDPYDIDFEGRFIGLPWCGTGISDENFPIVIKKTIHVSAKYDVDEKTWAFYFNGKKQRQIILYEDTEYYFNLSDASLYGEKIGLAGFLQKNFAISTTPDGTHNGGSADTNFVTSSLSSVRVGTRTEPIASRYENRGGYSRIVLSPEIEVFSVTDISTGLTEFTTRPLTAEEEAIFRSEEASRQQYYGGYAGRWNEYQALVDKLEPAGGYTDDQLEANLLGYVAPYLRLNIPKGAARAGNYYYYSPNFSGMGGVFQVRARPKIILGEGDPLILEREDVQETAFLLEAGSQDRDVGHTDKLIMEDSFNSTFGTPAQIDAVTNFLGVVDDIRLSLLNQGYEPTFFMNEDYRPIKEFENLFTFEERDSNIFNIPVPQQDLQLIDNTTLIHPDPNAVNKFFPRIFTSCVAIAYLPKDISKETFRNYSLLDNVRENLQGFIALDGTDEFGSDAGSRIVREELGNILILERTDLVGASGTFPNDTGGTDARDGFLLGDEIGAGTITLNASDSSSNDTGDDIILESGIDFSNSNITITDSSGASGTIISEGADIATATTTVATTSKSVGSYRGINNLLGQDLVRIQDSFYYQDYSYEIRVGQSLVTYFDELKKAVHPAGFQPFGKVSIATLVSAAITNAAAGVSDYTGDTTTFSPELASVLETIFSQVIQSRTQVPKTIVGQLKVQNGIELEDSEAGHEQSSIVLDGTDSSGSNTGDELKLEAFFDTEQQVVGTVPIGSRDDKIVQETGVLPGDNLVLDASATDTDVGANLIFEDENLKLELGSGNIVLNGTDSDSSNAGDNIRMASTAGFDLESGLAVFGDSFLYETFTITSGDLNTSGVGDGGGRIMSETSFAPSGKADGIAFSTITKKLVSRPLPKFERNLLLYLAETPFGNEPCGITLEAGSGNLTDSIVMDGQLPFNEGSAFMELERDSEIDNIILDGTDELGTDAGEGLVLETGFFLKIEDPSLGRESETFTIKFEDDGKLQLEASIYAFPIGFHVSDGDRLLFDTLDNDETIPLSDISSLTFQDIRTVDKFEIQGLSKDEENWGGAADDDKLQLENFGQLVLNATLVIGTRIKSGITLSSEIISAAIGATGATGDALLLKTVEIDGRPLGDINDSGTVTVRDGLQMLKFELGVLSGDDKTYIEDVLLPTLLNTKAVAGTVDNIVRGFDSFIEDVTEGENDFLLAEETTELNKFTLEESGNLVVERYSTLSNISKINVEDGIDGGVGNIIQELTGDEILLEQHTLLANRGQIPVANFRLNSTSVITKGNVRSADVSVRDTGDISLEDATDDTHGYLVINSTSGSSTNAGENFDLEGATGITY